METPPQNPPRIFLSYSSADSEFALKLSADLQALGVTTWLDRKEIHQGNAGKKRYSELLPSRITF